MIEHVDTILRSLNEGNKVDVIYLDYSKAFDKVDHQLLLAKMKLYGISGKVYSWIERFLTDRQQTVVVDGEKATFRAVTSGVPQGTALGPIFFVMYVIESVLAARNSKALTFTDDTKLLKVIKELLCKALLGKPDQCHPVVHRKQHATPSRQVCCDELLPQHLKATP